jgi:hypothetical protein
MRRSALRHRCRDRFAIAEKYGIAGNPSVILFGLWDSSRYFVMLRSNLHESIPPETERVACAALEEDNRYRKLREKFGTVFSDQAFEDLFSARGQPATTPWRLALVTVMQFAEGLSDREAADAVRARIDWKLWLAKISICIHIKHLTCLRNSVSLRAKLICPLNLSELKYYLANDEAPQTALFQSRTRRG